MGLRLAEGIDPARYQMLSGRALDEKRIEPSCARKAPSSWKQNGRLRVTQDGFPVLDAVVADLAA
jgi:coproporphyrinogen III oxidase-like Fe-S oxidoreductase